MLDADLEAYVARASDPRLIPSIYSYCNRRCARCHFNDRCFAFAEDRREEPAGPGDLYQVVAGNLGRAFELIQANAERQGIDLLAIRDDPATQAREELCASRQNDFTVALATEYAMLASKIVRALDAQRVPRGGSLTLADAVDSISWLCTMIGPKIYRALSGLLDHDMNDEEPIQNDANGSAKIARLMIADSLAAWRVVNAEGRAPADALSRQAASMLDRIDADLAARFPLAMAFVRPGFDQPSEPRGGSTAIGG